jgi:predicted nucleic acid-binding protein
MKVFFDTSVLVAAVVEAHGMHERALPWLQRAKAGGLEMYVSGHALAEIYAVLTGLPVKPKITPATAMRLVEANVLRSAKVISLSASDYRTALRRMSEAGLSGGVVYDALIATSARKAGVDRLLTMNTKDSLRVWPEGKAIIQPP